MLCPLNGFRTVAAIYLQAAGKPVKSAVITLCRQIVFLLPAVFILPLYLGVEGILWSGPVADGLAEFMRWAGPDAVFAEWGLDDVPVLKQNLFLCGLDERWPAKWYNLQRVFLQSHPRKEGEGMTLESVVDRMGIEKDQAFHNALVDALYNRTEGEFARGSFRVKGDVVDVFPAYGDYAYRIEFFGDEIEEITMIDPVTSLKIETLEQDYERKIILEESEALMHISGGDARKLLNAVELVVSMIYESDPDVEAVVINNEVTNRYVQNNLLKYDRLGEMHYDIISAFIKSIRGSDPNAAVYYLARMIDAGEDPLFIARRMLILSSEDIGNANPNALLLANACFDAVNKIGFPESRIILSQTAIYLASSLKSNASYLAIDNAQEMVRKTGDLSVPLHLRNAPTKLMKDIGYSDGYKYAHDYAGNFVEQEFLPKEIAGTKFYEPQNNPKENELRNILRYRWKSKYNY